VAAANSLSDIYAMGARPITAMNIVGFPKDLSRATLKEILRGGAEKTAEAGVPIVGGHTIDDEEPKYGLAVTGVIRPGAQLTNAGARPGDVLVLTKPIGTGVITTAARSQRAPAASFDEALRHMTALNKAASEAVVETGVHACTDVTGFGLLGHLRGMAKASGVSARVRFSQVPFMTGAWELGVKHEISPGGTTRNRAFYDHAVAWDKGIHAGAWRLLYDPQTSGGLLAAVTQERAERLLQALRQRGLSPVVVGEVTGGRPGTLQVVP
jgi:selenide,water dikinase